MTMDIMSVTPEGVAAATKAFLARRKATLDEKTDAALAQKFARGEPITPPVPSQIWERWVPFDPNNERHTHYETFSKKTKRIVDHPEYGKLFLEKLTTEADKMYADAKARVARGVVRKGEPPPDSLKIPATADDVLGDGLIVTRADSVKPKSVKWLWNFRIPMNKFSVLAGNPDQGKSLISMNMAAQLTQGLPMYGDPHALFPPSSVLIMAAEDDASDTIVPRLQAAGADLKKVHLVGSVVLTDNNTKTKRERQAQLDKDVRVIEEYLKRFPDIRMVVIDPISSFLGNANMNKEQEVRGVLTPLKELADRRNVAIVGVMHLNKVGEQSAIHRIGGAVAFTGVARAVWLFMQDENDADKHLMLRVKNNIAKATGGLVFNIRTKPVMVEGNPTPQPIVNWIGETDSSANDIMSKKTTGRPDVQKSTAVEWLRKFLSAPQTSDDVKSFGKKEGHSWGTLRRAKDEIGSHAFQDQRTWYWELPPKPVIVEREVNNTVNFNAEN